MIAPETRALLVTDAKRAINLLGLDSDREGALADMVVANMEGSIASIYENARRVGHLQGAIEALQEVMLERRPSEDPLASNLLKTYRKKLGKVQP